VGKVNEHLLHCRLKKFYFGSRIVVSLETLGSLLSWILTRCST